MRKKSTGMYMGTITVFCIAPIGYYPRRQMFKIGFVTANKSDRFMNQKRLEEEAKVIEKYIDTGIPIRVSSSITWHKIHDFEMLTED